MPPRSALRPTPPPGSAGTSRGPATGQAPRTIEEFIEFQEVSYYDYELGAPCYELKGYVIVLVETAERGIRLYGSPAGMDGLGVADEILDVNEIALPATASRMDFLKHLYESIQSCVVKLRVKKSSTARIAQDLGPFLQDAFVIAVEDEARKRLAKLAAVNKVTPVDITELAKRLNSKDSSTVLPGGAGDPKNFPVYVTSLAGSAGTVTSSTAAVTTVAGPAPVTAVTAAAGASPRVGLLPNGHGPARRTSTVTEEPELILSPVPLQAASAVVPTSVQQQQFAPGGNEVLLGEQLHTTAVIENQQFLTPAQDRPRRRSGGSIVVLGSGGALGGDVGEKPRLPEGDYPPILPHHIAPDTDMLTVMSLAHDNGPHREMAVDVPDSFVARNKTPPRYPPPKPPQQMNGSVPQQGQPVCAPIPSVPLVPGGAATGPVPPPREHLRIERDGRLVNRAPAPQVPARTAGPAAPQGEPTKQQMESIRKYQDQLRKRREEEERLAQQNEFLRASLRGSAKLRALQQAPPLRGALNQAYTHEDEDEEQLVAPLEQEPQQEEEFGVGGPAITTYGELSACLQRVQQSLRRHGAAALAARCSAAQGVLLGAQLARALATRQAAVDRRGHGPPAARDAQGLARECTDTLRSLTTASKTGTAVSAVSASTLSLASELCDLLGSYEMEGLLQAHDRVARAVPMTGGSGARHSPSPALRSQQNSVARVQNSTATQSTGAPALLAEDDGIRIIQIEKTNEPLGATIRNEGEAVIIGRVVRGGAAEKTGLLHEGDELLEVNGVPLRGKSVNDVCAALAAMSGTLTLLVAPRARTLPAPGSTSLATAAAVLHVRAHFDYDPEEDLYIPCRELGIGFQKGDVLHVISRDDPNWWQAFREGEEDQTLAGLVPSQAFQHQRESMKQSLALAAASASPSSGGEGAGGRAGSRRVAGTLLCSRGKAPKRRKRAATGQSGAKGSGGSEAGYPLYAANASDDPEPDEILTYEEVALYYPRANHKRPVVLIGPPNIGRHELRQRLMGDSERFAAAVPHTSRPRGEGEVAGQDYHFISRAQFEADILARRFVEHGEYEKAYYGTSLDAIRSVVASGKICVLNLHPQSLRLLRSSDLKPYTVLVAPPSLEKLRQKRLRTGEPYKEDELKDIIATAREMEARWGHLFDMIIINNDTERAYQQLLSEINSLEREPQWVPAAWLH